MTLFFSRSIFKAVFHKHREPEHTFRINNSERETDCIWVRPVFNISYPGKLSYENWQRCVCPERITTVFLSANSSFMFPRLDISVSLSFLLSISFCVCTRAIFIKHTTLTRVYAVRQYPYATASSKPKSM